MANTNPTHHGYNRDPHLSAETLRQAMGPGYQIAAFTNFDAITAPPPMASGTTAARRGRRRPSPRLVMRSRRRRGLGSITRRRLRWR